MATEKNIKSTRERAAELEKRLRSLSAKAWSDEDLEVANACREGANKIKEALNGSDGP